MKQEQFLDVVERDEAARRFREAVALPDLGSEDVDLSDALGRVLAENVISDVDVPGFDRANMDGWAVRAEDTYGATEAAAVTLRAAPTTIRIGELPDAALSPGEAMAIPTGGALPRGADAVLQVEATITRGQDVSITRAVTPGTALSYAGTDIARGETMLRAGATITSREIGVLAAIGRPRVRVRRRPRVAILSTGDELVAHDEPLTAGKIYDANAPLIAAAVREQGGEPIMHGIVGDDASMLRAALESALAAADMVILSGGTSKGPGDLNAAVLRDVLKPPGIVVHGVALKPGKPICLAASGNQPVVVLPGFPTSAIFTFHDLVAPTIRALAGVRQSAVPTVSAKLPFRFRSDPGRRQYELVHLVEDAAGELVAYPIGKGSGSITTWSSADGYFVVPQRTEHVESTVAVFPLANSPTRDDVVIIGSHCVGLDLIITFLRERGYRAKLVAVGSEAGLEAAKRGACDIAPIHLLHEPTGRYNAPFISDDLELVRGYGRMQGLVFRPGETLGPGSHMINRNRGSGTRALIDKWLGDLRLPGHSIEASSHHAVAAAVQQRRADFGIAISTVAADRNLAFIPLQAEHFDFAIPRGRRTRPAVAAFIELLKSPSLRAALATRGFLIDPAPDEAPASP